MFVSKFTLIHPRTQTGDDVTYNRGETMTCAITRHDNTRPHAATVALRISANDGGIIIAYVEQ